MTATGPDEVWLLTMPHALLHWVDGHWEQHDLPALGVFADLYRLRVVANQSDPVRADVWLSGSEPVIARYRLQTPAARLSLPVVRKYD